ncbi:Outer membrane receptor for ferrienterochelin and colicins [Catalinimonas alkaloidigena]|uniref:Outer membrane receptor for ferrienterochelin and colicins n=1 Tax=Catalinimonas alkaloidigena TaxID=1075417 RepID=A0A1G9KWL6_9BACT|nr:TonB-dependent receptor plug domain-containing protein [Catalinimonas alkaloidigena]SDL53847.1 Outer membrane receptor for ferrienterochelin and colicins [Catalinimonas alkaloidigena]
MSHLRALQLWITLLAVPGLAYAQSADTTDLFSMPLEELADMKNSALASDLEKQLNAMTQVASQKPLALRNTPGIITVIRQEEIAASGARDLIDVLRLVPGMDFGVDVQNTVGLGIRGNWAAEGKILLLLDGQEMNETLYATIQLGNHFDVSQIKRIEIIRGPGSALYGGYAEYGVISIITHDAADLHGLRVTTTYGHIRGGTARRNVSVSGGQQWGDVGVQVALFAGQSHRSDGVFQGVEGSIARIDTILEHESIRFDTLYHPGTFAMMDQARLDPLNLNLSLHYKGLQFRTLADHYRSTTRDGYGVSLSRPYRNDFVSFYHELKYNWAVTSKLKIVPRLNFKQQTPYRNRQETDEYTAYDRTAQRLRGQVLVSYAPSRQIALTMGGEFFRDRALSRLEGDVFYNEQPTLAFTNEALFGQALLRHRLANVTIGARYDHNNAFGSAFVPRLGITRQWGNFHGKLLYGNSFRAPGLENVNLSLDGHILPERTRVIELEAGLQLSKSMFLTANLFDMNTQDPIFYFYDEATESEGYTNYERTGSRGLEVEYNVKTEWGFIHLNYAFYSAAGRKQTEAYEVADQPHARLAFPVHRVNLNSSFRLFRDWRLSPTASVSSARYAYLADASLARFAPTYLANVFVQRQHFLTKGLEAGVGVYDVFNQRYTFLQPYDGGHAPLPGTAREWVVRLSYTLDFN